MPRITLPAELTAIRKDFGTIPDEFHSMILKAVVRQCRSPRQRVTIRETDILFITPLRFDDRDGRVAETPAVHTERLERRPDAHLAYAAVWNTHETGVEIHFLAVGRDGRKRTADHAHEHIRALMRAGRKVIPPHRLGDILGGL